jgi:4-hydroxy-tetrahydrodipicolinate synthase
VQVVHLLREGRLAEARAQWQLLLPLIEALFAEPNPGPLKAVLANEGWMQDELRAPMTRAGSELREPLFRMQAALSRR